MVLNTPWADSEWINLKKTDTCWLIYKTINRKTWGSILAYSKSIGCDKCNRTTVTLVVTFLKTMGRENMFIWFGYNPYTIFYHNQGKVSGSMNPYPINAKTRVKNKQRKSWSINLKYFKINKNSSSEQVITPSRHP